MIICRQCELHDAQYAIIFANQFEVPVCSRQCAEIVIDDIVKSRSLTSTDHNGQKIGTVGGNHDDPFLSEQD